MNGNGNNRLYRSTSEAMVGGVAAGLGNYFKVDPTIIRLGFVLATIFTSGAFLLVYLAMWLLIPTAGSTATEPSQVIHENLDEMGAKVRGFTGSGNYNPTNGQPNGGNVAPGNTVPTPGQPQAQATTTSRHRQGIGPMALVLIGGFFLLANTGVFHMVHWHFWWPLLLIGLGVMRMSRRRQ